MPPPPPQLTSTVLKTYVQQFLLPDTTCLTLKKKTSQPSRSHTTQFEETKQALEADMAGMLK